MTVREAWTNWNPEPVRHAFGAVRRRRTDDVTVALCGVIVRQPAGEFDPADPGSCPTCAEAVTNGWTFDEARRIVTERMMARIEAGDPTIIVCGQRRRGRR